MASILISVAVYGQASSLVTNLPIVGGILACGVFLILISLLGLAGAVKHHQVMLFFVSFKNRKMNTLLQNKIYFLFVRKSFVTKDVKGMLLLIDHNIYASKTKRTFTNLN